MKKISIIIFSVIALAGLAWGESKAIKAHDPLAAGALPLLLVGGVVDPKRFLAADGEFNPEGFAAYLIELRANINAMLSGLPPLEQFEASAELSYGLRSLQRTAADLIEMSEQLRTSAEKFVSKITAKAEQDASAKVIAGGEYMLKTDAQAAQDAALAEREQAVRTSIAAEQAAQAESEARRTKLVTDKVLTATVASEIPLEFFQADGYEDRLGKLKTRLGTLQERKLTTEPFVASVVAIPLDEAGDKIFEARLKSVEGMALSASRQGGGAAPSLALPTQQQEEKIGLCF